MPNAPERIGTSASDLTQPQAAPNDDSIDPMQRPVTGRAIVQALSGSPLAEVDFERISVELPVRDVPGLARGIADAEAGRTIPLDEAFQRVRKDLNLPERNGGK